MHASAATPAGREFDQLIQTHHILAAPLLRTCCIRQWLGKFGLLIGGPIWDRQLQGSPFCGLAAFDASHATVFFGQYDDTTREFRYVNCGQHAPILIHATGGTERLEATGMPLGLFADWHGSEHSIQLRKGDRLLLFSDGVIEAGVETGHDFGEARIVEHAAGLAEADAATLVEKLARAVREYAGRQHDDLTIVGLKSR